MSPLKKRFLTSTIATFMALAALLVANHRSWEGVSAQARTSVPPILFVSRAIPSTGTIYWSVPKDMPGVGPYSRFRVAAPGRLSVLEPDGSLRVLVDGGNPTAASLNLIDVNAPDVSFDGLKIVFAGITADRFNGTSDTRPLADPDGWRLYVINADGSGLRQLTVSDQNLNYSQFGNTAGGALRGYDDTDPAWLPDGRVVFSSTRWPAFGQYSAARTSNLHVVNADGSGLHRITSERNGADRPIIDPITGKIVFSRWWRNQRFAINSMETIRNYDYPCCDGYEQKDGLTRSRDNQLGRPDFLFRNSWHAAFINPDGTDLAQFAGPHQSSDGVHVYGGAFAPNGELIANYFPMTNMTEAAGFGGLRRYRRGTVEYEPIIGITSRFGGAPRVSENPPSFGILQGNYAAEPAVLADGRIVISWAEGIYQDYGLYLIDPDGGNRTLLFDRAGTTELQAKLLEARPTPPIIADSVNPNASLLPPTEQGPYDIDGSFVFDALNVYGNGPVDSIEASAPRVGTADKIRFFADFQRVNWGSLETLDWPILLGERQINDDGSVREPNAPANIPLFEQIRSADGAVPFTLGDPAGAAHVAGMNYGKPGATSRCIGCHSGHTMIPVPESDEAAKWSNLAPGASISASSSRNTPWNEGLIDRKVMKGSIWRTWASAPGATVGQWVELTFPEPVTVRTVRLHNIRFQQGSTLRVEDATVRLGFPGTNEWVASGRSGEVLETGTDVEFPDVRAQRVRVEIGAVSGRTSDGYELVSLAEVEVIARAGEQAGPTNTRPTLAVGAPLDGTSVEEGSSVGFRASASDDEDGDLSSRIVWTSSLDGQFASGADVSAVLSVGAHTVTARVTDDGGLTAGSSLTVTVTPRPTVNTPPSLSIGSPANGTSVQEGSSLGFSGSASDAEDGVLSNRITWTSNLDGQFGSGASVSAALSIGTHSITARVTDDGGLTASSSITVSVTERPTANTRPTVSINSPVNGASVPTGTSLSFSAAASDAEDGNLSNRITWTSSLSGQFGTGANVSAALPVGTHTVTARVTDDGGLTAGSSINVIVESAPQNDKPTVASIDLLLLKRGSRTAGRGSVWLVDGDGRPVAGATLEGYWAVNGQRVDDANLRATDSNGMARASWTSSVPSGAQVAFVINGVQSSAYSGPLTPVSRTAIAP